MPTSSSTSERARDLQESTGFRRAARAGYAVSGLLHILIGWIAIHLAFRSTSSSGGGSAGTSADQEGALAQLGEAPWGASLLWFSVIALVALAAWQAIEAVAGEGGAGARVRATAKAITYLALGVLAWQVAQGGGSGDGSQTGALMSSGLGRVAVAAAGAVVVGVGGYHVYKGLSQKFTEDLQGGTAGGLGRGVIGVGVAGYAAKGVALVVVGVLFVVGAVQADPEKVSGLDVALRTQAELPFGKVLLVVVACGFVAYGFYSFARSRYARM